MAISPNTCAVKFAPQPRNGRYLDPLKILKKKESRLRRGGSNGWMTISHAIDYLEDPDLYHILKGHKK